MKDYVSAKERLTFSPTLLDVVITAFWIGMILTLIYICIYEVTL